MNHKLNSAPVGPPALPKEPKPVCRWCGCTYEAHYQQNSPAQSCACGSCTTWEPVAPPNLPEELKHEDVARCGVDSVGDLGTDSRDRRRNARDVEPAKVGPPALQAQCPHGENCACVIGTRHEWFVAFCRERDKLLAVLAVKEPQ